MNRRREVQEKDRAWKRNIRVPEVDLLDLLELVAEVEGLQVLGEALLADRGELLHLLARLDVDWPQPSRRLPPRQTIKKKTWRVIGRDEEATYGFELRLGGRIRADVRRGGLELAAAIRIAHTNQQKQSHYHVTPVIRMRSQQGKDDDGSRYEATYRAL